MLLVMHPHCQSLDRLQELCIRCGPRFTHYGQGTGTDNCSRCTLLEALTPDSSTAFRLPVSLLFLVQMAQGGRVTYTGFRSLVELMRQPGTHRVFSCRTRFGSVTSSRFPGHFNFCRPSWLLARHGLLSRSPYRCSLTFHSLRGAGWGGVNAVPGGWLLPCGHWAQFILPPGDGESG